MPYNGGLALIILFLQKSKIPNMERLLQDAQRINTSGQLNWRIDNISQRMEEARNGTIPALYSQPFFTNDGGEENITLTSHDCNFEVTRSQQSLQWRFMGVMASQIPSNWTYLISLFRPTTIKIKAPYHWALSEVGESTGDPCTEVQ